MSGGSATEHAVIDKSEIETLIQGLWQGGYTVVGPTIAQSAIVIDEIKSAADLPIGWTDLQEGGSYRLKKRDDQAYFGYAVGPHSWKKYLFPARLTLYTIKKNAAALEITAPDPAPRYAFLGVRGCDLRAIEVQDRTFLQGAYVDPHYKARREQALVIAVNCAQAASTCFCTSMGSGPRARGGYDLALTEFADRFLVEVGSERGQGVLASLASRPAVQADLVLADDQARATAESMTRTLDVSDMPGLFYENLDHPRWDQVAERCLSCTNCTMVCPTCFCHSVDDVPDLAGETSQRVRVWDSCFNPEFSHVAGGNTRPQIRERYRQWLTHKLASWVDQFGVSGCVGCGRCITWCPVGIDLTEETAAIRGRLEA